MLAGWLVWGASIATVLDLQEPPLTVRGEVQYTWLAGRREGRFLTQGNGGRVLISTEKGLWEATASYLFDNLYRVNQFDETNIAYRSDSNRIRIGRFLPKIGQSNWYDQWNSGFVFLPDVENWIYFGELSLWQTTPGAEIEIGLQSTKITLTALDNGGYKRNDVMPRRFDRQAMRIETYQHNLILGVSAYTNLAKLKDAPNLVGADFRTSGNHWVLRGEAMMGNRLDYYYRGFFVDLALRPPGQEKLTLLARYDTARFEYPPNVYKEWGITLGAKYVLPGNWSLSVNYIHGSFMPAMGFETGWALGLSKTIAF